MNNATNNQVKLASQSGTIAGKGEAALGVATTKALESLTKALVIIGATAMVKGKYVPTEKPDALAMANLRVAFKAGYAKAKGLALEGPNKDAIKRNAGAVAKAWSKYSIAASFGDTTLERAQNRKQGKGKIDNRVTGKSKVTPTAAVLANNSGEKNLVELEATPTANFKSMIAGLAAKAKAFSNSATIKSASRNDLALFASLLLEVQALQIAVGAKVEA